MPSSKPSSEVLPREQTLPLNIVFDNCSGQNKNNTVLKLAAWLMAMGYFKSVQFIFLVVGQTKNAADRLFNLLKHEYRKQNLFTIDELVRALDQSATVTVHRTVVNDFFDSGTHKTKSYLFLRRRWFGDDDPEEQSGGAPGVYSPHLEGELGKSWSDRDDWVCGEGAEANYVCGIESIQDGGDVQELLSGCSSRVSFG
jgi:hypothetical protein